MLDEEFLGCAIAGLLACVVSWLELDRTFYVPKQISQKAKFYGWWLGFILLNGLLAAALYRASNSSALLKQQIDIWYLRAIAIGASYLALVRLKFGTFQTDEGERSIGIEALYEGLKEAFLRRITSIVTKAVIREVNDKSKQSLPSLFQEATDNINYDALLQKKPERQKELQAWVNDVINDAKSNQLEKAKMLAYFILKGPSKS